MGYERKLTRQKWVLSGTTPEGEQHEVTYYIVRDNDRREAIVAQFNSNPDLSPDRTLVDLSSHTMSEGETKPCWFWDCEQCHCDTFTTAGSSWLAHTDLPDRVIFTELTSYLPEAT